MRHPYTEEEIAYDFFSKMNQEEKEHVKNIPNKIFMSIFEDTVGGAIRQDYALWYRSWRIEIVEGADISPQYPKTISKRILELIWEHCHAK